jgi:hypothetical protein
MRICKQPPQANGPLSLGLVTLVQLNMRHKPRIIHLAQWHYYSASEISHLDVNDTFSSLNILHPPEVPSGAVRSVYTHCIVKKASRCFSEKSVFKIWRSVTIMACIRLDSSHSHFVKLLLHDCLRLIMCI